MNPSAGNPVVVVVGQGTHLDIVDSSIDFLISTCATLSASDQHKRLNQLSQDLARLHDQKQALIRKILESNAENGEPYDPLQKSRVVVTVSTRIRSRGEYHPRKHGGHDSRERPRSRVRLSLPSAWASHGRDGGSPMTSRELREARLGLGVASYARG